MMAEELIGHVCQLNYHGGGVLERLERGILQRIAFSKSDVFLHIGQRVSFRTQREAGGLEAVDIALQAPIEASKEERTTADDKGTHLQLLVGQKLKGDELMNPCFLPKNNQLRSFLKRLSSFQNAEGGQQMKLVVEAERSLDMLMAQSILDGDAICRLVRKCASWLRPPVVQTGSSKETSDQTSEGAKEHLNLQHRVRQILIKALDLLDLQDTLTLQAVQAAMFYLASLLQGFSDRNLSPSATTASGKQWLQLQRLLEESHLRTSPDSFKVVESAAKKESLDEKPSSKRKRRTGQIGYRKAFSGTVYEPMGKTKVLATVFEDSPMKLMCSECSFTIYSSWRFQHPKSAVLSVLAPRDGHSFCQLALKKRCSWRSLEESLGVMPDISSNMEFCKSHQRLLTQCAPCGGKKMCIHSRQKYHCKDCGRTGNAFCKHGRRRRRGFQCPDCLKEREDEANKSAVHQSKFKDGFG